MKDDKDEDRKSEGDGDGKDGGKGEKLAGREENPEVVIAEATIGGLVFQDREKVSWELDWRAYDVPRIWSILEEEDTEQAAGMVMAFNKLAQYVQIAGDDLTRAARTLSTAWTGSESATSAQTQLQEVIQAFQRDEEAHANAAYDIERIVNRIAETKTEVQPIMERWMGLADIAMDPTLGPMFTEVVDTAAKQADAEARNEMFQMEQDLSNAQVTSVPEYRPSSPPTLEQVQKTGLPVDQADLDTGPGSLLYQPPPPLPDTTPVGEVPDSPRLAGIVPRAVAGGDGPSSMIPLSPGHPMAPNGGAYVLGSGSVVSRPAATPTADAAASARPMGGMMGMGGGMIGGMGGHGGGGAATSGKADTEWEIMRGVGPVIGLAQTAPPSKAKGSLQDFDGWYASLAMPWKKTK